MATVTYRPNVKMNRTTTEESVGCRCFINRAPPLSGIIKHLYSDFHVHEIAPDGTVIRLTSVDPLPLPAYPTGYLEWLSSSKPFFQFTPDSDLQAVRIYTEQPSLLVTISADSVQLERLAKRRTRHVVTAFVLHKENMSEAEAISRIAALVDIPQKNIG
jgi:tRNA pseudouridine13 synthase